MRWSRSARLRAVARTSTSTSSGPGSGSGASRRCSTSGPPCSSRTMACTAADPRVAGSPGRLPRRLWSLVRHMGGEVTRTGRSTGLVGSPAVDFAWAPELQSLRREAEEVAAKGAAGRDVLENSWINSSDRAFSRELGERGWLGMTWPVEHGGHGRTPLERFVVYEAMIGAGAPIAATWFCDRQMGPSLLAFGTDEQRKRFLPDMVAGTAAWCIGMSEPDSGSDLASLRTRAVLDGDSFVVSGTKVWTSFAANADWCYLICRTDPERKAHEGLSELIVDMRSPGITVTPIVDLTGDRHFAEVVFDEVRVPEDHVVGELNGAWKQTMRQLEHERGGIDRLLSNRALYRDSL